MGEGDERKPRGQKLPLYPRHLDLITTSKGLTPVVCWKKTEAREGLEVMELGAGGEKI